MFCLIQLAFDGWLILTMFPCQVAGKLSAKFGLLIHSQGHRIKQPFLIPKTTNQLPINKPS